MNDPFPVTPPLDLSPLGEYFRHSDRLPDKEYPEKREAVAAARKCGDVEFLLIHELTNPDRTESFVDLIQEVKTRSNALPILKAALMVEKSWTRRFFAINAFKETVKRLQTEKDREEAVQTLTEIVSPEIILEDEIPGEDEELAPAEQGAWSVITDGDYHILQYAGKERARLRGFYGNETLERLARQFRIAGTVPGRKKQPRCAIDHANPDSYLAKHATSPELPLDQHQTNKSETNNKNMSTTAKKSKTVKPKPLTPQPVDVALPAVELIPASQFRRYPSNRQIPPDKVAKMADSVREVGVIQPITARPVECRWLGCCEIDDNYEIPCFVRPMSDKDAARVHTVENFQRTDLDEIEEARAIQHLKDTGWTIEEIMVFLGREKSHIYLRLKLLALDDTAHAAIREGNLTLRTAEKIASLPKETQAAALEGVVHPTFAAKALPERQAMEWIENHFVAPAKAAEEWEKRRKAIMENHPGAKWQSYKEARDLDNYANGYVRSDEKPGHRFLSDAAREEELVVPTWAELAKKHGAQLLIGCSYNDEAHSYVKSQQIIDAEKAACSDNPADCIFIHEAAVHQAREASEQKKREREASAVALKAETLAIAKLVLSPDAISKTASKKLVEMTFLEMTDRYQEFQSYALVLDIDLDETDGIEKTEAAILKYLRTKALTPFDAAQRLNVAGWIVDTHPTITCEMLFESGAIKPANFPEFHKVYQECLAEKKRLGPDDPE
jgi:ParB/RepB/Spo0J family partition protein